MDKLLNMDKMTNEVLDELEQETEIEGGEKKAFYTKFPKKLFSDFEKVVAPHSPTKAFIKFMAKAVKAKGKRK